MSKKRVWFHIILTTYGVWLPGDPRGFRTRHHREHIEGDYKNPPPEGEYENRHRHAKRLSQQKEVVIPDRLRSLVGKELRERLQQEKGEVLIVSVNGQHIHLQVQLDDGDARQPAGRAKRHVTFELKKQGWTGKLWGVRCKIVRIKDRTHQRNVYYYILGHEQEGAWVWSALRGKKDAQG